MLLRKWLKLAKKEKRVNLHKFNADFELAHREDDKRLDELWARFEEFLAPRDFETATEALKAFTDDDRYLSDPFLAPKFCGPRVDVGEKTLTTQLPLPSADDLLRQLGDTGINKRLIWLNRAVNERPESIPEPKTNEEWGYWRDTLMMPFVWERPENSDDHVPASTKGRLTKQTVSFERRRTKRSRNILTRGYWVTYASDLDDFINVDMQAATAESPGVRALRASDRRYYSGLFHKSHDPEKPEEPSLRYNIALDIRFELTEPHRQSVTQPTIFSGGYDYLFVSWEPDKDQGGRAARLVRAICQHDPDDCECAKPGANEVIVSGQAILGAGICWLEDIAVLMPRYGDRYNLPDVQFVRDQFNQVRLDAA